METIGSNIKKLRLLNNFSNLQLSRVSGLSRSYISELEKGTYDNVGSAVICKLCIALKTTPNELIPEYMWKMKGSDEDGITNDK